MAIKIADKRIINGHTDVNQIIPTKYEWARQYYWVQFKNRWSPHEVAMTKDVEQWKTNKLTHDEMFIVERNLGFFSTADSLAANNIVLGTYEHITAPECRQFLLGQAEMEVLHTESYLYIVESLGLDQGKIFDAYHTIKSIRQKDEFLLKYIHVLQDPYFKTGTFKNDQALLKSLIVFACIMEGLFFYVGFAQIFALGRRNLLNATCKQYQFISRDEVIHAEFGMAMIRELIKENPQLWTNDFKNEIKELFKEAVRLEYFYADDTMPRGVLGLNKESFIDYLQYIADFRLNSIGLPKMFNKDNPFRWIDEMMGLKKEQNFFEGTNTEYQTGSQLEW